MNYYLENTLKNLVEESVETNPFKLGDIKTRLVEALDEIYSSEEKKKFLDLYSEALLKHENAHRKDCPEDDCMYMRSYETAKYFIEHESVLLDKKEEKERFWRFGTVIENLNITGDGQLLNFGAITGSIYQNTSELKNNGFAEVSEAIDELTKNIEKSEEITENQIREYLDCLKLLSQEALKKKDERLPKSILKDILKYSLGTLNAVGSLASVSGMNLPIIVSYFLSNG